MLETLDDGINVTRIFKKVQRDKNEEVFEVFGASNLPSQEITKENVIHLLYRTHTYKNTRLRTETTAFYC